MKTSTAICLAMLLVSPSASAEEALVAVATNFSSVAEQLKVVFESKTKQSITITSGSTGNLYAQILNGAPYDVFLAADQERPMLLEKSGDVVDGSRFTFASGRLALWSADPTLIKETVAATLQQKEVVTIAIANPKLAPYGSASREALQSMQLWEAIKAKIVMGQNVGQAYALIATGNAQIGIVALSLVIGDAAASAKSYLTIPENLHSPIHQDAVLLRHGSNNAAAIDFLSFLGSDEGRALIRSSGYLVN